MELKFHYKVAISHICIQLQYIKTSESMLHFFFSHKHIVVSCLTPGAAVSVVLLLLLVETHAKTSNNSRAHRERFPLCNMHLSLGRS